jgi:hypothetical protein
MGINFEIKTTEQVGELRTVKTYFLFCNDVLIDTTFGESDDETAEMRLKYIRDNFEQELIIAALNTFKLAHVADGFLTDLPPKGLYRKLYQHANEKAAQRDIARRNRRVGIGRGRQKGSKSTTAKFTKSNLLAQIALHAKSFYEHTGKAPTQEEIAIAMGFGYGKRLYRELKRYGETRNWHDLVNDLLASGK